jgi:hypothetical protein
MADQIPYDIKVRRTRFDSGPRRDDAYPQPSRFRDLDDLEAAGIVAADQTVCVVAVWSAEEEGNHPGEPVPALYADVYPWEGEAVVRWTSMELRFADKRGTLAMRQVLARAQRIADLANDLATGTPIPMDGPVDRVVDEVAADMQRSWGLFHCSEATAPTLGDNLARSLSRHAIARLDLIRVRDGGESLF